MFRALFDRLAEPVEIRDAHGACVARNPAAARAPLPEPAVREALTAGSARLPDRGLVLEALPLDGTHTAVRALPEPPGHDELSRLLGRMAHDMTEPLRLVTMYTQLLERHLGDRLDATARRHLDVTLTQVARLQQIIDGLLELSLVDRQEDLDAQVDLHELVTEAAHALDAPDAHVTWEDLPPARGSAELLARVFAHLLDNAVRYRGDAPPEIHVRGVREGERVRVEVRDNGIGVDPAYHDAIFEPFVRLHGYDERPGTGLGLAFCRRAAKRMGGALRVDAAPGRGSRFTLTLRAA